MIYYIIALLISIFLYQKVFKMYWAYFYYRRQGIPCVGFPLPIIGNLHKYLPLIKQQTIYSKPIFEELWERSFNGKVPKILLEFRGPYPVIMVTHCDQASEIIGPLGQHFDKDQKFARVQMGILGHAVIISRTNESTFDQRKRLTKAFYKEKLQLMIEKIIPKVYNKIQQWKTEIVDQDKPVDMITEMMNLTNINILTMLYGSDFADERLDFYQNGKLVNCRISDYFRIGVSNSFKRGMNFARIIFDCLDTVSLTKTERQDELNWAQLRKFASQQIKKRKQEIMDNPSLPDSNFLTILLKEEFYKDREDLIIDELMAEVGAGTITSALTLANLTYYLTLHQNYLSKILHEFRDTYGLKDFRNFTVDQWRNLFTLQKTDELKTLSLCLQETLRMSPPGRQSFVNFFNQNVELTGKKIRAGDIVMVNMAYLHYNKDQWQSPEEFIPERFDPFSPCYLTPSGKKRNTASYLPFWGGRRVCLGKTFAEYSIKCIMPMILTQIEFEFADSTLKDRKPMTEVAFDKSPKILMKMKNKV